jgi:hypothetical protein
MMNEKVRDDIVADMSSFFRPQNMSVDAVEVYTTLMLISVLNINVKESSIMKIYKLFVRLDQQSLPVHNP